MRTWNRKQIKRKNNIAITLANFPEKLEKIRKE